MHILQTKIFNLSQSTNLGGMTYRQIGKLVGDEHPQKIKHHMEQLQKKGLLKVSAQRQSITSIDQDSESDVFMSIPVLGAANCGQALTLADEHVDHYLQVSKSLISSPRNGELFAVKAIGDSMNEAVIGQDKLENGDYAIVRKIPGGLSDFNGKYVLSIIDGMANIKKLDVQEERILLRSVSTHDYPPIVISKSDYIDYMINGIVDTVIKH